MTTDEIIEQLDSIVGTYEILLGNGVNSDILGVDDIDAIRAAIKLIRAIEDIKAELWMEGMNMTGEYQGVWVRYRDIERVIDKHISGKEQKL